MRAMALVRADEDSEAGVRPTARELAEMTRFNERLAEAGVMLAGEGLHRSSRGHRIRFAAAGPAVLDGPFAGTGSWWRDSGSGRSARGRRRWTGRAPFRSGEPELRAVFESEECGEEPTPDLRARETDLRRKLE